MTNLAAAVEAVRKDVQEAKDSSIVPHLVLTHINHLETILAELGRGAAVPAGWVLVPIEPNWDMRNEGREFLIDGLEKEPEKLAYFLWKTMVAASPKELEKRDAAIDNAQATEGK